MLTHTNFLFLSLGHQVRETSVLPSFQEAEAAVVLLVVVMVVVTMVMVMVVIMVVVVMPTMRWWISVGLLPVVEITLVPRRRLLRRRVVRHLGRRILSARRRVRLRVPCANKRKPNQISDDLQNSNDHREDLALHCTANSRRLSECDGSI